MKSWTRTLNIDDAHTLLALAQPGVRLADWSGACHTVLPSLSQPRRRELIRILRESFLDWRDDRMENGLFLRAYAHAPADAQVDLVALQWALSHPIAAIVVDELVRPALAAGARDIPLSEVERVVAAHVETSSRESLRKTRTVLLGALEGVGALVTKGTGQHRSLRASRGRPHPLAFAYLVQRDLAERGRPYMEIRELAQSGLCARVTACTERHMDACLRWCLHRGVLTTEGSYVGCAA